MIRRSKPAVVVIGAGISGLCSAYYLHRAGVDVTVLERNTWVGGTMRTLHDRGWMIETGPNSALETTPLFGELLDSLRIKDRRIYADPAADRRYIVRDGSLHALPLSPAAFLTTRLWTARGKLRVLAEPFIRRGEGEESVAGFVKRRLGTEFLDYAINPFVAGVYAGNPEELSVRAAFPKLYALEVRYGGLFKGMIGGARERRRSADTAKDRAKMFSFEGGMQDFPRAISASMNSRVQLGTRVLEFSGAARNRRTRTRYLVTAVHRGRKKSISADAVVISVPAFAASDLVKSVVPMLRDILGSVHYPPVAEVFLGFREEQVGRPLDGFGFLVPEVEKRKILGTIWSSTLFPARAPEHHVALTTFVGGSRQPGILETSDRGLVRLVTEELQSLMAIRGMPAYARVIRWQKAIPQYRLGYNEVTDALEGAEAEHPGLFFCSNFRGGIAVGDCLVSARHTADNVGRFFTQRG